MLVVLEGEEKERDAMGEVVSTAGMPMSSSSSLFGKETSIL
jgi:hypothetical protein